MDLGDNKVYFRRPLGSFTFTSFPLQLIFETIERVSDGSDCDVAMCYNHFQKKKLMS
jgi:hypothetical protein